MRTGPADAERAQCGQHKPGNCDHARYQSFTALARVFKTYHTHKQPSKRPGSGFTHQQINLAVLQTCWAHHIAVLRRFDDL